MKLERTGTASSKKSNQSITSASDISAFDNSKDTNLFASNGFSSAQKSTVHDRQGILKTPKTPHIMYNSARGT